MKKESREKVLELALRMNSEGRKNVLKDIGISERTWSNWIKDTGIKFNRETKMYEDTNKEIVEPIKLELEKTVEDKYTEEVKTEEVETKKVEIEEVETEKVEIEEVEKPKEVENNTIDIMKFINSNKEKGLVDINNKENITNIEMDSSKNTIEDIKDTEEIKDIKVEEVVSKENKTFRPRNNFKKEVKEGYQIYRISLAKEVMKRINALAVSEDVPLDLVIEDLLNEAMNKKYYKDIDKRIN